MWIDDEGVAHSVALPDPAHVMTGNFRSSLDTIAAADGDALRSIVKRAEARAYGADWSDLDRSKLHVGAPPPAELLQGRVTSPEDVDRAIFKVAPRWRLDAILALDDYLD